MKGLAMKSMNEIGWIEKEKPKCGPLDALMRPIAVSPCTSYVHTVWEGELGDRHDMILVLQLHFCRLSFIMAYFCNELVFTSP